MPPRLREALKPLGRHLAYGGALSFLFFTPYLATFQNERRLFGDVAWGELWYFAGALLLLAAALAAALLAARALSAEGERSRAYSALFSALLCGGVFLATRGAQGPLYGGARDHVLAAGLGFLAVASWGRSRRTMLAVCRAACALLVPAAAVALLSLPSAPAGLSRVTEGPASGPARPVRAGLPDVFLFLFDAWSYDLTFPGGKVRADMPNLRELLAVSTLYHRARSPALWTEESVPAILFGRPPGESIFAAPERLGYRTRFAGVAIDRWGLEDVDRFDVFPYYSKGALSELPFLQRFLVHFPLALRPYLRGGRRHNINASENYVLAALIKQRAVQRIARDVIEREASPAFALFHYYLPHAPHVFDREGLSLRGERRPDVDEARAGNLRRLDAVIGEITEALKRSGRFDGAALVLFSDHSDVVRTTHVPLIIKRPGQHSAEESGEPVELVDLRRRVEALIRS